MVAKLIALVVPLGLDTFAVAAALGMIGVSRSRQRQISVLFTAVETGMPSSASPRERRWAMRSGGFQTTAEKLLS